MGFGTPPAVAVELEGDYSDWTIYDSFDGDEVAVKYTPYAVVNKAETEILLVEFQTMRVRKYTIATKSLGSLDATLYSLPGDYHSLLSESLAQRTSVLMTYFVGMKFTAGWDLDGITIWKGGVLVKSLSDSDLGFNSEEIYSVSISRSGKYIIVSGERSATGNGGWVVLEGS